MLRYRFYEWFDAGTRRASGFSFLPGILLTLLGILILMEPAIIAYFIAFGLMGAGLWLIHLAWSLRSNRRDEEDVYERVWKI